MATQEEPSSPLKVICLARLEHDYHPKPEEKDKLSVEKGDMVKVYAKYKSGWWVGEKEDSTFKGMFPGSYAEEIPFEDSDTAEALDDTKNSKQKPPTTGSGEYKVAIRGNHSSATNEIQFEKGDLLKILEKRPTGWWKGEFGGKIGNFPSSCVVQEENSSEENEEGKKKDESGFEVPFKAIALFPFTAQGKGEISLQKDDVVQVLKVVEENGWWKGKVGSQVGHFPGSYVMKMGEEFSTSPRMGAVAVAPVSTTEVEQVATADPSGNGDSDDEAQQMKKKKIKNKGSRKGSSKKKKRPKRSSSKTNETREEGKTSSGSGSGKKKHKKKKKKKKKKKPKPSAPASASSYHHTKKTRTKTKKRSGTGGSHPKQKSEPWHALFDYEAKTDSELSFKKGEVLYIINKEGERGWWLAEHKGKKGHVPSKWLKAAEEEATPQQPQTISFSIATTDQARREALGEETKQEDKNKETEKEKKIKEAEEKDTGGTTATGVATPPEEDKENNTKDEVQQTVADGAATEEEIVCRAVALYPYEAKSGIELSLIQGDTVEVLDKSVGRGWWKGRIGDKVGHFPLAFVEETAPKEEAAAITTKEKAEKETTVSTEAAEEAGSQPSMAPSAERKEQHMEPSEVGNALHDYTAQHTSALSFKKGDTIKVTQKSEGEWWQGEINGNVGFFPVAYYRKKEEEEEEEEKVSEGEKEEEEEKTNLTPTRPSLDHGATVVIVDKESATPAAPEHPGASPSPTAAAVQEEQKHTSEAQVTPVLPEEANLPAGVTTISSVVVEKKQLESLQDAVEALQQQMEAIKEDQETQRQRATQQAEEEKKKMQEMQMLTDRSVTEMQATVDHQQDEIKKLKEENESLRKKLIAVSEKVSAPPPVSAEEMAALKKAQNLFDSRQQTESRARRDLEALVYQAENEINKLRSQLNELEEKVEPKAGEDNNQEQDDKDSRPKRGRGRGGVIRDLSV